MNNKKINTCFNFNARQEALGSAKKNIFDLIIIGGGITGAGISLDASSRGIATLLIEKSDFSSGTSSRSTKLIHGGLRYLKSLELKLVRDVGRERTILLKNAPHLVIAQKLILPIYKKGSFKKWQLKFALSIYDWLAGVRKNEKKSVLDAKKTLSYEPLLEASQLLGAGVYTEYRTDDARLTLEIIKTSINYGATAFNYLELIAIEKSKNLFIVHTMDHIRGHKFTFKTKNLVNATGPWTDQIRKINYAQATTKICLSKGVHIVLKNKDLPIKNPVYFDTQDKRMCFAIPRNECTYIGTTDTLYTSNNKSNPGITKKEVDYIINAINSTFNISPITHKNIISFWSGLRPLIHQENKSTKEISRKDEIIIDPNNMISIAGGKLTGFRIMAKKITDIVAENLQVKKQCSTHKIKLCGSENLSVKNVKSIKKQLLKELKKIGLNEAKSTMLFHNYGTQTEEIITIFNTRKFNDIIQAEAVFCLKNESTYTLIDFFSRRNSKLFYYPEEIEKDIELVLPVFRDFLELDKQKEDQLVNEILKLKKSLTKFV